MGELSSIILAGGKSTRMGFDKQLLEIQGELIVNYLGKKLREHFQEVVVVTNTPELYAGEDFVITQDIHMGLGPMAGIHAGLSAINTSGAFVIACDMPNTDGEFIDYISSLFLEKGNLDIIISRLNGFIEPMNGIYSKKLVEDLDVELRNRNLKLKNFIENHNFHIIEEEKFKNFPLGKKIFENINDGEALEKFNLDNIKTYDR